MFAFNAVPLYFMPVGFHLCLHSRQGGFKWSCVGKWQLPFFLLQMGHCLYIMARFVRQASCPLRTWGVLLSVSSASSIASKARIWGSKISGPASLFPFCYICFYSFLSSCCSRPIHGSCSHGFRYGDPESTPGFKLVYYFQQLVPIPNRSYVDG